MRNQYSRGGSKPQMLANSKPIHVEYSTGPNSKGKKEGIYETDGPILARRVELPHSALYLTEKARKNGQSLLSLLRQGENISADRIGESQGQMYWHPNEEYNSALPLVGVDVSVWDKYPPGIPGKPSNPPYDIEFHVYEPDYKLVEIWSIYVKSFRAEHQIIQPDERFMAQYMISVSFLQLEAKWTAWPIK